MILLNLQKRLQSAAGEMLLEVNCEIEAGQFVTLYGVSGVGKTSTLRMLAGLMQADSGSIQVDGKTWLDSSKKINIPPQERGIAYVFQDYALFPNMSVRQNLAFALPKNQDKRIISELIDLMELGALQNRKPATLSGGQQQRVALARALVQSPRILLLDEPLAALDRKIRLKLQDYLLQVHRQFQLTTILISHDIGEISKLSDRVLVLEAGKIIKDGIPAEIFINKPLSGKFQFIGEVLHIEVQEVIFIVTVLIQNTLVKVVAQADEVENLAIGDKVVVASKAFNPILYKV